MNGISWSFHLTDTVQSSGRNILLRVSRKLHEERRQKEWKPQAGVIVGFILFL